jgi:transcription elongation factor GreA
VSQLSTTETPADVVGLGSKVAVLDLDTEEQEHFMLVLAEMMDLEAGHISLGSPLGRALRGRRVGEEIEFRLPRGQRRLRILEIGQG